MQFFTTYASPLGKLTLCCSGDMLTGLWIQGQKYFQSSLKEPPVRRDDLSIFKDAKAWLDSYFSKERPSISSLPLAPSGSPFRQAVWKILCEIPYGSVTTYGKIAEEIARIYKADSMSAQAVGGAVGHNPISIIIPCHRVVGAGGNLTGYAGGIDKKLALLQLEGIDTGNFFTPKTKIQK